MGSMMRLNFELISSGAIKIDAFLISLDDRLTCTPLLARIRKSFRNAGLFVNKNI